MSQATVSEHEGAEYEQYGGEFSLDRISGFRFAGGETERVRGSQRTSKKKQVKKEKESREKRHTYMVHGK